MDRGWLGNPHHFDLRQWRYHATAQYGGPKREEQRLVATEAIASEDGRSVRLKVPGLREGSVVHLRMDPQSDAGEDLWSKEAWYTLNRIPAGVPARAVDLQALDWRFKVDIGFRNFLLVETKRQNIMSKPSFGRHDSILRVGSCPQHASKRFV